MFNHPMTYLKLFAIPVVLGASGYFWFLSNTSVVREVLAETLTPDDREMEVILYQSGITPEVLAAAGCTPAQAAEVVSDARTYVLDNNAWAALQSASDDLAAAKQQVSQLRRIVRAGQADQDQLNALATAKSNLATAQSGRQTLLNNVSQAALADLGDATTALISTIIANAQWKLPMEFHAVDRSEADWVELRNALAAERIATKRSESVPAEAASVLSAARNDSACSTAKSNLDANGSAVNSSWSQAISTE